MVTPCCLGRDGVGNTIRDYLAACPALGLGADVFHAQPGVELPPGVGGRLLGLDALLEERLGGAGDFFAHDLFVFQYVFWYPLLEAIRAVDRGRVLVEYHGITPPGLLAADDPYRAMGEDALARHELLDYADLVVVHSRFMRDEVARLHPVPEERVHVLPLGVAPCFEPGPPDPDLRARYAGGGPLLLYVGRLSGNKRVDVLLRALARLRGRRPGARLLLVGEHARATTSSYRQGLDELSRSLGLGAAVEFVSGVSDQRLAAFYRTADLFVTGSVHEGFCIPVAEASSCGLPAVVPDVAALPETLGAGGLLCAPDAPDDLAAVADAALEPVRRAELAARARAEGPRHSNESFQRRLREAFDAARRLPWRARPVGAAAGLLRASAVPAPVYADGYRGPLGPLVRWLRRKVTLPLEVSCLRPLARAQGRTNRLVVEELTRLEAEVRAAQPASPNADTTAGSKR